MRLGAEGLYFVLLYQSRVPHTVAGADVGLVSSIGDTEVIIVGLGWSRSDGLTAIPGGTG